METQIGNLVRADLENGTLTICVGDDIEAVAGHYAVVPIAEYTSLNNIANDAKQPQEADICHSISERFSDERFIANVCFSYRHDYGLLNDDEREEVRNECTEWMRAISNNERFK